MDIIEKIQLVVYMKQTAQKNETLLIQVSKQKKKQSRKSKFWPIVFSTPEGAS